MMLHCHRRKTMKQGWHRGSIVTALLAIAVLTAGLDRPARAETAADSYSGKTVNLLIGVDVGGEYDTVARLIGRHIGAHIPGNPEVVPQNMVGASGLKMANHLYAVAPQDGTYMGMMSDELPMNQALGLPGIQYRAEKFHWIGTVAPLVETLVVRAGSGIRTLADAREHEVTVGTPTKTSIHNYLVGILNRYAGTKFRMVTGYKGGNATDLAMEQGEVDGRVVSWSSIKVTKPDWIRDGKINVIAQFGPQAADLPKVPNAMSLAKTDAQRKVVALLTSPALLGRPIAVGPGVPEARVKMLRTAFQEMTTDPKFLADAGKLRIEVDLVTGEALQKVVQDVLDTPAGVVAQAKKINE
jgi:tripartite-type tricarboxylate transporter receptor subunit TctC